MYHEGAIQKSGAELDFVKHLAPEVVDRNIFRLLCLYYTSFDSERQSFLSINWIAST